MVQGRSKGAVCKCCADKNCLRASRAVYRGLRFIGSLVQQAAHQVFIPFLIRSACNGKTHSSRYCTLMRQKKTVAESNMKAQNSSSSHMQRLSGSRVFLAFQAERCLAQLANEQSCFLCTTDLSQRMPACQACLRLARVGQRTNGACP